MTGTLSTSGVTVDRETAYEIEQFLFHEAELLDSWRLQEWLGLVAEDGRYLVPATDSPQAADPASEVFIISDSYAQICGRVQRLESDQAFVEQPRSLTRRLISNIRAREVASGEYEVRSNFAVYRYRRGVQHVFVGEYRHLLSTTSDGALRIRERRATLDQEHLRPQGKVSFIL